MSKRDSFSDPLRPLFDPLAFRPYFQDRMCVKRLPWPQDSRIIFVPGDKREGAQLGEVVTLGEGNVSKFGEVLPMNSKIGERVIYSRVPPQEFEHKGETYTFLFEEQHILGIVE